MAIGELVAEAELVEICASVAGASLSSAAKQSAPTI
jgi:hypothetical protein